MRNRWIFSLLAVILLSCTSISLDRNAFFVSPLGNDQWSGKLDSPNSDQTDGPFATLERAQEAIRELKKSGNFPETGVTVYVRGGVYFIDRTLELTDKDGGQENAPVVWRNYPKEKVVFTGGKIVTDFRKLSDPIALLRIKKSIHDSVYEADLKAKGIDDYGVIGPKGFNFRPHKPLEMELIFKNEPMTLARYPNEGWLKIIDVPQYGEKLINKGSPVHKRFGLPIGRHYGRFKYEGNRPAEWESDEDVWMHGYWSWDWAETYEKAEKIDAKNHEVYIAPPYSRYGYTKGQRFYFLNVLAELDSPGEYYIDRKRGKLFFYPPSEIGANDAVVTILKAPMMILNKTAYTTVQGFVFENSRATALKIVGGDHNLIVGCVFRNLGNNAVVVDGGNHNGVKSSDLYHLAGCGILLVGGDRMTLTPGNNFVENSHLYRFGRVFRTYAPAIQMKGVGNRLAHNLIHDGPHAGVVFHGNEHVLEYNEIYDIAKETGDVGAFYIGRDWTYRGNIIRYNYFHDLHGPGLHGVRATYLDDFTSGITIFGNVFYRAGRAAFIGGGRDNVVENNIFVECNPSVQIDARGLSWAHYYFDKSHKNYVNTLWDRMEAVHYQQPPYSIKYPELLKYASDDPAVPKNNSDFNVFHRNELVKSH